MKKIDYKTIIPILLIAIIQTVFVIVVINKIVELENKIEGIKNYSINKLAVNEQNPLAKGFYEHMGFEVYKRTEADEQGNPYPLLYMKRD